jgi:predicted TIM-barrel fold metal-dependent hydrolase
MSYANGRLIHDADSHLMELDDCLDAFFTPSLLPRFHACTGYRAALQRNLRPGRWRETHAEAAFRAGIDANLLLRKNYEAHGAFIAADRPHALDLLGFASQLVFTTFCLGNFGLDQGEDMALCYAAADAHNRMLADFCRADARLLATAYVPLEDFEHARATAAAALRDGAKALMVPSRCPQRHAPSHVALDAVWAQAQEAGVPVLFHVGGEEKMNPTYKLNGLPPVPDFHGGDDNFTSVSYMPIPNAVMQTLATLIFDGVFDRFPQL